MNISKYKKEAKQLQKILGKSKTILESEEQALDIYKGYLQEKTYQSRKQEIENFKTKINCN